tara:strand:+ start:1291 stop:1677 length:387 start_codon:yes stop_codon:yes gene_type:complete
MKISIISLFIILLTINCDSQGIKNGGSYKSDRFDRLNAFYLYDYISKSDVLKHANSSDHNDGSLTFNYYFSYNANIPSHDLLSSKTIEGALGLIKTYSHSIKYGYLKNKSGVITFVNCSEEPENDICK